MPWPILWLEALSLLAVIFAIGIGSGFALSRLFWPKRPRRPGKAKPTKAKPAPAPAPVEAAPAPIEQAPAEPPPPGAVARAPQTTEIRQPLVTLRLAYPVNSFGGTAETRSNLEDQPSS